METLWFAGVCDALLMRVKTWVAAWPQGEVYATRPFMSKGGTIIDMPTMRLVRMPFQLREFEHLVKILTALRPAWEVTKDMQGILPRFTQCKPVVGGMRIVPIATFEADPQEILKALLEARDGKPELEQKIDEARKGGKGIWE